MSFDFRRDLLVPHGFTGNEDCFISSSWCDFDNPESDLNGIVHYEQTSVDGREFAFTGDEYLVEVSEGTRIWVFTRTHVMNGEVGPKWLIDVMDFADDQAYYDEEEE